TLLHGGRNSAARRTEICCTADGTLQGNRFSGADGFSQKRRAYTENCPSQISFLHLQKVYFLPFYANFVASSNKKAYLYTAIEEKQTEIAAKNNMFHPLNKQLWLKEES
ncbi:MAG: hypothetical protein IJ417_04110, partial [Bacteroidaceae bacterium]|nr:hypothetical protein [Bacteroidaceae bacterium]